MCAYLAAMNFSPFEFICGSPTPRAMVPVGSIVSFTLSPIYRISKLVISAPALIPIAYPAPVLYGLYHVLCCASCALLGLYIPAAPPVAMMVAFAFTRSEEHTSELQSRQHLGCRLL